MLGIGTLLATWLGWHYRRYFWAVISAVLVVTVLSALVFDDSAQWALALTGAMTGLVLWPLLLPRRAR